MADLSYMYWVSTITYIVLLVAILANDFISKKKPNKTERSFRIMVSWVILFCIQDTLWGLCFSRVIADDNVFFLSSAIFHTSTVLTTFFWLNYVLHYLGNSVKHRKLYLVIDGIVILFELGFVTTNFFYPVLFTIRNGEYVTEFFRPIAFLNQYIVYFIIGIVTFVAAFRAPDKEHGIARSRFLSVFMFALAPILTGVFQIMFPEAPFYSMGYFMGVFIIHIFVVSKDREDTIRESETQMRIMSIRDELTGLLNRRAYEEELASSINTGIPENLVFISADVNELKNVNDTLGHMAGDEMIKGAADCIRDSFGKKGSVYRIGGDEFCAIIIANDEELEQLKNDFNRIVSNWSGRYVDQFNISVGYSSVSELDRPSIRRLSKLAEERMYADKTNYYRRKGLDRRGQRDVHAALCTLYVKIVKANITEDTFEIINMDENEKLEGMGLVDKLSECPDSFCESGYIHEQDTEEFLSKTKPEFLRDYFAKGNKSLRIFYRRRINDSFRQAMMEIIPANDYAPDNESLYLYVRDIDR